MNSSCNDSEISSGGELSASRCTSSCGERSSVSELDLSCSASDTEELTKSTNAQTDNEAKTEEDRPKVEAEKDSGTKKCDEIKPSSNDSNNNVSGEQPATSQASLIKTESKRRSILLSNQVTKSKSTSISTAAPKLLLPSRDVLDGYDCCSKSTEKMVKFFTYFLREDVEYKTLSISNNTTSRQVIAILLDKVSARLALD